MNERLRAYIEENELLVPDGYEDCILGIVENYGRPPVVCMDKQKMLLKMVAEGMTLDEAAEFFEFNVLGAWMGDTTPSYLDKMDELDELAAAYVNAVTEAERWQAWHDIGRMLVILEYGDRYIF